MTAIGPNVKGIGLHLSQNEMMRAARRVRR